MTRKELLQARAERAYTNYKDLMGYAREALVWARKDRLNGNRDLYLDSMCQAEHWRIRALEWYRRYKRTITKLEVAQ